MFKFFYLFKNNKKKLIVIVFPVKVIGDPTVEIFGSRDIDSFIQDREAFAVQVNNYAVQVNNIQFR